MIALISTVLSRLHSYFLFALLTTVGGFHFLYVALLLPLKLLSPTIFRKAVSIQLYLTVPGFLCIPFSWVNCRAYSQAFQRLKDGIGKDQLLLANHSGRIDWLFGLYTGRFYGQRVGFVTEATIMFLPLVGWQRYLVEDIFVFKSFKRDKERIMKNIEDFKASKVKRWMFLCPEGHIADFAAHDEKYIHDCQDFCREQGYEPFEMVLTPRYKGMQCFSKILENTNSCVSATMTYVQNGERLVKPLSSSERVVPDLWTVVNGNLECYIHLHDLELSDDPIRVKEELMMDYARKDRLLSEFYHTGKFPPALPGKTIEESPKNWQPKFDEDLPFVQNTSGQTKAVDRNTSASESEEMLNEDSYMQVMTPQHFIMNLSFFGQFLFWYALSVAGGFSSWLLPSFVALFLMLTFSHLTGELLSKGQSRESVPFEGILKGLMSRYKSV